MFQVVRFPSLPRAPPLIMFYLPATDVYILSVSEQGHCVTRCPFHNPTTLFPAELSAILLVVRALYPLQLGNYVIFSNSMAALLSTSRKYPALSRFFMPKKVIIQRSRRQRTSYFTTTRSQTSTTSTPLPLLLLPPHVTPHAKLFSCQVSALWYQRVKLEKQKHTQTPTPRSLLCTI